MNELTDKQKKAVKQINTALRALKRADIMLCGMDGDIYYATGKAIRGIDRHGGFNGEYCEVAMANQKYHDETVGTLNTSGVYQDSGGW